MFQKRELAEKYFNECTDLLKFINEKKIQIFDNFEKKVDTDNIFINQKNIVDKIYFFRIFDKLIMEITLFIDSCHTAKDSHCKYCT